jgi:hypothetical protein
VGEATALISGLILKTEAKAKSNLKISMIAEIQNMVFIILGF